MNRHHKNLSGASCVIDNNCEPVGDYITGKHDERRFAREGNTRIGSIRRISKSI